MIKSLVFDFGDVFINLDKQGAMDYAMDIFNMEILTPEMIRSNMDYEMGLISTSEFIEHYRKYVPGLSETEMIDIWNYIIKDFPRYRLKFLKELAHQNKYQIILLSNTNDLHIDFVKRTVPFFEEFKSQFDKFYLSHEINLRTMRVGTSLSIPTLLYQNVCPFISG